MKIKRIEYNGSCYSVKVTKQEVLDFKDAWPCSRLPGRAITFYFDRKGLVDLYPDYIDGESLSALAEIACFALCKELGISERHSISLLQGRETLTEVLKD
jgi:hypothetical protein